MPKTGNPITVERDSMMIVYDQDGRISDVHHFVTAKGGKHPSEKEQEKATLELAARREVDDERVAVVRRELTASSWRKQRLLELQLSLRRHGCRKDRVPQPFVIGNNLRRNLQHTPQEKTRAEKRQNPFVGIHEYLSYG